MTALTIADMARAVPKVDLHCHLSGSISPRALIQIAELRNRPIDIPHLKDTFDLQSASGAQRELKFFEGLDIVATFLQTPDDLAFAVNTFAQEAAAAGNLKYVEMFVNPTALMRTGMSFVQMRDGLVDGADSALQDHGVTIRFIACFLREESTQLGEQMLDELLNYRTDEFIGVGLDGPEHLPISGHARFAALFQRAGRAGFKRTAHFTETAPTDLLTCLHELGCDRIDHGYPVVDDPDMLQTLKRAGTPVTCCLSITRDILGEVDNRYLSPADHPITQMMAAGLPISLGTDDGALVGTDIGQEYALASQWYSWGFPQLRAMSLFGLEASWLDDSEQRDKRSAFEAEFTLLGAGFRV